MHRRATPEAAPVLQPHDRPARLVAHQTLGRDGQIALHPLVRHHDVLCGWWERQKSAQLAFVGANVGLHGTIPLTYPIAVLDDVLADAGERCPFAVGYCFGGAALMHLAFAHLAGQPVGGDAGQCLPAHVAVRRAGVGCGIPFGWEILMMKQKQPLHFYRVLGEGDAQRTSDDARRGNRADRVVPARKILAPKRLSVPAASLPSLGVIQHTALANGSV